MSESSPPRVGGSHWWDSDRARHVADRPHYCPGCGGGLDGVSDLLVEYWEADQRTYHIWCRTCSWTGDISRNERIVGHEPE